VIYLSQGGGPCFFMDWSSIGPADTWNSMADFLKNLHRTFPTPKAIVVISAHWEENEITVMSEVSPSLLFDYYGFPKHTYELTYPAHGSPVLASRISELLKIANINSRTESKRGFDHGVFVPFKLIYPDANIPIVQVSMKHNLDPVDHIALGRALTPLRDEGVLIVGSGMSYHNLHDLFKGGQTVLQQSKTFDQWLFETASLSSFDERNSKLAKWKTAPSALQVHPREDHLIPLMVVSGAAGNEQGKRVFNDVVMGAATSAFQFG
jgi:aromatic ring-opening dioxygenase catalytic subunit (LigB family)